MLWPHCACMRLLLLLLLCSLAYALPVSNPEIANKSAKTANSLQQVQQQQQQQQQQQHQHQHQQQLQPSSANAAETHLKSLSVYAGNYENLPTAQAQVQPSLEPGFKPSYKMPEMETNFTPMQQSGAISAGSATNLPSTPMLMQYLPAQALQDGGGAVQYLQLIPTRPIIVPISPYLAAGGAPSPYVPSATLSGSVAAANEYAARAPAMLTALQASTGVTGLHYAAAGLQSYANAVAAPAVAAPAAAAYRTSYRINREAKDKHFPASFSLNLNEYLPALSAGHDVTSAQSQQPHTMYLRARA